MSFVSQIRFRNVRHDALIVEHVEARAARLSNEYRHVYACRASVESPPSPQSGDQPRFQAELSVTVAGGGVSLSRSESERLFGSPREALDAAFEAIEEHLQQVLGGAAMLPTMSRDLSRVSAH